MFFVIITVILFFASNSGKSQKVDCDGVCLLFSQCELAQDLYKNNKTNPIICGYKGLEPIVCCTNEKNQKELMTYATGRISKKKCHEVETGLTWASAVAGYEVLPGEYRFMAAIGYGDKKEPVYNCGGVLVEKNVVITAAHCTSYNGEPASVVRVGGDPEVDELTPPIPIIKRIIHPNYSNDTAVHDIAILFLSQQITNILPLCMWIEGQLDNGTLVESAGYGAISFGGPYSRRLLKVYMNVLDNDICEKAYAPQPILNSQLCVLGIERMIENEMVIQDTCQGDSGGPVLRGKKLVGIVSYGQGCGSNIPGIYTNISSYLDWIEKTIWPDNNSEDRVYIV